MYTPTIRLTQFVMLGLLLFLPFTATATDAISSNSTSNATSFELTSSSWYQPNVANLTLTTDAGTTIIIGSIEARMNSTGAKLLGRILRDGVEITRVNLTEVTYISNIPVVAVVAETTGTHTYGFEILNPAGKKTFVNRWSLGVTSIKNGAYLTEGITNATALINISQVVGLQLQQDAQNTSSAANDTASRGRDDSINSTKLNKTDLNSTVNFVSGNAANLTGTINYSVIPALPQANVSGLVQDLAGIRTNDTNQATYLNNTFPGTPYITILGTIATGVWHGTTIDDAYITSYALWNGYQSSKWNKTDSIPEANLSLNYPTHAQAHTLNGTDHTGTLNYNRVDTVLVQDINISSASTWNSNVATVNGNLNNWNATYNSSYNELLTNAPNNTVANNLVNWNATNATEVRKDISSQSSLVNYNNLTGIISDSINASAQLSRTQVTGQEGVDIGQNSSISNIQSINLGQNSSISNIESVNSEQNQSISNIQTVNNQQNTTEANQATYLNSTFPGSSVITTLGIIISGVWNGVGLSDLYINSSGRWNAVLITHNNSIAGLQGNDTTHDAKFNTQNITNDLKWNKTDNLNGTIDHTQITNIGVYSHSQIDTAINSSSTNDSSHDVKFNNTNNSLESIRLNNSNQANYDNSTFVKMSNTSYLQINSPFYVNSTNTAYLKNTTLFCGANTSCNYAANGSITISSTGTPTSLPDYFDGNGYTKNFTLSSQILSVGSSDVYVNGVKQRAGALGSYIEHPAYIEFASPPRLYDLIEVRYV